MNKLDIFEAVNMIDDDIVKEAAADNAKPENTYDKDIIVSGVEKYGGITWHRIAAIASAVLLIAGIGAGGALMLKRRPPLLVESVDTTAEDTTENNGLKAVSGKEKSSSENAEVTTAQSTEADVKETKESVNTEEPTAEEKDAPDENVTDGNTDVSGEEDIAVVTTAVPTTVHWKTSPPAAETKPKPTTVTTAEVHYPNEKTTLPSMDPSKNPYIEWQIRSGIPALTCYPEDTAWLNNILRDLAYQPYTCDGLPEAIFNGSDGNVYQMNFSEGWIWRNGREEVPMPDEIRQYFKGVIG